VQELIKEIASSAPIITAAKDGSAAPPAFKVVVLNEVERLSKPAQHGLRRTMEKYSATCRLILVCNNPCKVIAPIRSRCLCFRIAAPTHEEIASVLQSVATKEGLKLPLELAMRISASCERNLRRSVLTLEACKVQQYPFSDSQPVQLPDWQLFINAIADEVLFEQSPKQLLKARRHTHTPSGLLHPPTHTHLAPPLALPPPPPTPRPAEATANPLPPPAAQVRGKLYELLANCIPADLVMCYLTKALLKKIPLGLKHQTLHYAAQFEHRMQAGSKPIFHIEAYLARFMSIAKQASSGTRSR
jgi:replication factor C subunit 3/5